MQTLGFCHHYLTASPLEDTVFTGEKMGERVKIYLPANHRQRQEQPRDALAWCRSLPPPCHSPQLFVLQNSLNLFFFFWWSLGSLPAQTIQWLPRGCIPKPRRTRAGHSGAVRGLKASRMPPSARTPCHKGAHGLSSAAHSWLSQWMNESLLQRKHWLY